MLLSDAISPVLSPRFVGNCCDGSQAFLESNRIQSSPRKHLLNNAQRETAALLINRNKELKKIHRQRNIYWITAVLSGGWWDSHQPLHKPDTFEGRINQSHWTVIISSVTQHRIWVRITSETTLFSHKNPSEHRWIIYSLHLESHIKMFTAMFDGV